MEWSESTKLAGGNVVSIPLFEGFACPPIRYSLGAFVNPASACGYSQPPSSDLRPPRGLLRALPKPPLDRGEGLGGLGAVRSTPFSAKGGELLPKDAKQKTSRRRNGNHEEFMSTCILHDAFTSGSRLPSFRPGGTARAGDPHSKAAPASEPGIRDRQWAVRELEWLLIWLQILLYLAGTYLFWAKAGAAWPF